MCNVDESHVLDKGLHERLAFRGRRAFRPGTSASDFLETFGVPRDPPILLISGGAASMDWWDAEFCGLLAGNGRVVIRYDHRDTGRSVAPPGAQPSYTAEDFATDPRPHSRCFGPPVAPASTRTPCHRWSHASLRPRGRGGLPGRSRTCIADPFFPIGHGGRLPLRSRAPS